MAPNWRQLKCLSSWEMDKHIVVYSYNRIIAIKRNGLLMKPSRTPWGTPRYKSLPVSPVSFLQEKNLQPPRPFLSSRRQIQIVTNQGSEGIQKQRRSSQEAIILQWGRVLDPPQGMCIAIGYISLSSSAGAGAPTQVEDGNSRLSTSTWTLDWLEPEH